MAQQQNTTWYPDELLYTKANFFLLTNFQLLSNINSRRNNKITMPVFLHKCRKLGLRRGIQIRWSKEDINYLKNNYKKIGDSELTTKLNRRHLSFRVINNEKVYRHFTQKHVEKKRELLSLKRTGKELSNINKRNIKIGLIKPFTAENNAWVTGSRQSFNENEIRVWKENGKPYKYIKINNKFTPHKKWYYHNFISPVPKNMVVFNIDMDTLNDSENNLELRARKVISRADYKRALPLIQLRISNYINKTAGYNTFSFQQKLEYQKGLKHLLNIQKTIMSHL